MASYRDEVRPLGHGPNDGRQLLDNRLSDDLDEDAVLAQMRDSTELASYDRSLLQDEEEQEKLLLNQSTNGLQPRSFTERIRAAKLAQRNARNLERQVNDFDKRKKGASSQRVLMYEMEEGGPRSRTPSSDSSLSSDVAEKPIATKRRKSRFFRFTIIHFIIVGLFAVVAFGAYKASRSTNKPYRDSQMLSNGTSIFAPTTIIISLDGFRADFLELGLTPYLKSMMLNGISARYMTPSFPSVTFPNHFTMVTGLYPESHGIVGNTFWDPELEESFYYTDTAHSMQPKWWNAEPIWATAELQGVRTAIHMWPGSEAHIGKLEPTDLDKFNETELLPRKVDRILELLDKPGPFDDNTVYDDPRPQFIAAYVPNVDADGHKYGPNSTEVGVTVVKADRMIGDLVEGLRHRNLTDVVNLIVVSDHGMATTSTSRLVQLEDLIDTDLIERIDGWPHYGLRPKKAVSPQSLYEDLIEKAKESDAFDVYLREQIPERFHFQNNERIAPLWIFPRIGWAIVTKDEYDVKQMLENGDIYHPRGIHGYDNQHPLMRAIFVAQGPAFPHLPGSRVDSFQNINVYNILCDSLGITPNPNNGTLRLPLKPAGLHGDKEDTAAEPVQDFPPADPKGKPIPSSTSQPAEAAPTTAPVVDVVPERPTIDDEESGNDEDAHEGIKNFDDLLDWFKDRLSDFTDWVSGKGKNDDEESSSKEST